MTESLRQKFGARVRQLRKTRRWTQEKLAEKAGMEYKHLGAIERGEKNVTINNIERIAHGLAVEPHQLFLFSLESLRLESDIAKDKIVDLVETAPGKIRPHLIKILQCVLQAAKSS